MKYKVSNIVIAGLILFSVFTDVKNALGQVVQSESFDGVAFPPAGWTNSAGGNPLWVRRTVGVNPACTMHSGAAMARFTSFMAQPGSQEELVTSVADFSGASGSIPTFSLWVYRDNSSTAGDSVTIFVNTAPNLTGAVRIGGVARSRFFVLPVNELANGWYNYTFNVPASFNTNTNYFILRGTAHNGGNIFVDDVQWTEYPVACSAPVAGNAVATDTLICNGSGSTTLSLANGSGLSGGGLTFQWQSASTGAGPWTDFGASAISISSGTISASTWFRCFVTCSAGAVTDSSTAVLVNVNPNPSPVVTTNTASPISFCTGSTPLDFIASGALYYVWNPNIAINVVGDSAQTSPTSSTTFVVIGYDSVGCSGSASIIVNVSTTPNVNSLINNDTICNGQTINISASVSGGNAGITFLWQPGSLTGANQSVSPAISTTYVVSATNNMSGCVGYDSVSVVVNPTPVAGFTYAVNNLTYTFTNTSVGGVTYLWDFGDLFTDTTANPVHTYAATGNYTVTLTVSNGACSNTFTVFLQVLSISDVLSNGSQVLVFPNPAADAITLKFIYDASSVKIKLVNSLGQMVADKVVYPVNGNLFDTKLNIPNLGGGTYFLNVQTATESIYLKVIKN